MIQERLERIAAGRGMGEANGRVMGSLRAEK